MACAFLRRKVSPVTSGLPRSTPVDLDEPLSAPKGWERCLDLQTGKIFYRRAEEIMSRNNGKGPKLDLKLNLSPPARGATSRRVADEDDSPKGSSSSSPPSSCLSSCSNSPEAASMVLAGCPRCLMYVMLSEEDPRCPKCKSAVLLDFLHGSNTTTTTTTNNNNNNSKTRKS
ncbi:hypothetical protein COCNU_15G000950 [Cocos nucifera]|uniref:GIR1-like zinc ribbon domain-containing protein n=1 Tax=Cocos nucifera TaxID=13894 RepID=A0A8K0NCK2_COCNU|nr:hypothetical protein COCNU_15G000950 [Cocos nucifera]